MEKVAALPRHEGASLLLIAACAACGDSSPPASTVTPTDALTASEGVLRDSQGRQRVLRGVNARVAGIFDVTFDDGRAPVESIPAFTEADCAFIAEELGMNHLRLPVSWSAIEPVRGEYRDDYVDAVLALAAACDAHGVATLVDLHQDAFSKHIGEDGAPLWAIVPPPTELLSGPLTDLDERRTSAQVIGAFDSFFNDAEGVQQAYADMAGWLAGRIAGQPGVLGLELMNEPVVVIFANRLDDFDARVGDAVRAAAPALTIFFEPDSLRNLTDSSTVLSPIGFEDAVYSPHVYVDVFEDGWASEDVTAVEASVDAARREADAYGAALYVGEFGNGPDEHGLRYVRACLDVFDARAISSAWWLYEETSQGAWGLYDPPPSGQARGPLREEVADALARPYPSAVAGTIESFSFEPGPRRLTVALSGAAADVPHEIAIPHRLYPGGVTARCDGVVAEVSNSAGRADVVCGGSELVIEPAD